MKKNQKQLLVYLLGSYRPAPATPGPEAETEDLELRQEIRKLMHDLQSVGAVGISMHGNRDLGDRCLALATNYEALSRCDVAVQTPRTFSCPEGQSETMAARAMSIPAFATFEDFQEWLDCVDKGITVPTADAFG